MCEERIDESSLYFVTFDDQSILNFIENILVAGREIACEGYSWILVRKEKLILLQ